MSSGQNINWEDYREVITDSYIIKKHTQKELLEELNGYPYFLCAKKTQLGEGLQKLALKRNARGKDWPAISYHKAKRKRCEGKDTDVFLHGIRQDPKKVRRESNRNRLSSEAYGSHWKSPELPEGVELRTPPISPLLLQSQLDLDFFASSGGFPIDGEFGLSTPEPQSEVPLTIQPYQALPAMPAAERSPSPGVLMYRELLLHRIPWFQISDILFHGSTPQGQTQSWIRQLSLVLGLTTEQKSALKAKSTLFIEQVPEKCMAGVLFRQLDLARPSSTWDSIISGLAAHRISNNLLGYRCPITVRNELWRCVDTPTAMEGLKWVLKSDVAATKAISSKILHEVVSSGDAALLRRLFHLGADQAILQGTSGGRLLCTAIYVGHLDMTHVLIDGGADVNYRDDWDGGPLQHLAKYGPANWHAEDKCAVLAKLLDNGADINGSPDDIQTPLYTVAIENGDLEFMEYFFQNGADGNQLQDIFDYEEDSAPPPDDIFYSLLDRFGPKWHWMKLRGIVLAARDSLQCLQQFVLSLDLDNQGREMLLGEALVASLKEKSIWCRNRGANQDDDSSSDEEWASDLESDGFQSNSKGQDEGDESDLEDEQEKYGHHLIPMDWTRSRSLDRIAVTNLLQSGADPNASIKPPSDIIQIMRRQEPQPESPLQCAIRSSHTQDRLWKAQILLRHGADPHKPGLLEEAISMGDVNLSRILLAALKDSNHLKAPCILALSFLMLPKRNRLEILGHLSLTGLRFDINQVTDCGLSPLQHACKFGSTYIAEQMIGFGADVNGPLSQTGKLSALHFAVLNRNLSLIQLLLKRGARLCQWPETPGKTLFECWAQSLPTKSDRNSETNSKKIFRFLLESGAEVIDFRFPALRNWGSCAADLLYRRKREEFVRWAIEYGLDLNCPSRELYRIESPLELAVRSYDLKFIKWLIQNGANADVLKGKSLCQLFGSVWHFPGVLEKTTFLLEFGIDPNRRGCEDMGNNKHTALQHVCEQLDPTTCLELVQLMIKHGADLNAAAAEYRGRTAIQAVCARESTVMELVKFLTNLGADINAEPAKIKGLTALQGAAMAGHFKIVLYLLEMGAKVDADGAKFSGRTALEGAAELGRLDIAQALLNAHQIQGMKARCARPLMFAEQEGHWGVVEVLKNWIVEFGSAD